MQGYHVGSRAIRVAAGNSNNSRPAPSSSGSSSSYERAPEPSSSSNEYSMTNLYVSGFPPHLTEHDIGPLFVQFGDLNSVKVLPGRGVGFVNFNSAAAAENAMRRLQGFVIGGVPVKISFAKVTNPTSTPGATRSMAQPFGQTASAQNVCFFSVLFPLSFPSHQHSSSSFILLASIIVPGAVLYHDFSSH